MNQMREDRDAFRIDRREIIKSAPNREGSHQTVLNQATQVKIQLAIGVSLNKSESLLIVDETEFAKMFTSRRGNDAGV